MREEAVVFKEDQAADDFEVQVIDEKPPATTEQIDDTFRTPDDLDLPLNDEMEASTLSPVAWKKVSVIKRRVLRIDFSNDPLRKSQLPILYAVSSDHLKPLCPPNLGPVKQNGSDNSKERLRLKF